MTLRLVVRRLRRVVQATVAILVIAVGLLAGLVQVALPWLVRHPERVERFLAERLERPVRIERMQGSWRNGGPVLTLERLHIGSDTDGQALTVPQAELALDPWAWLWPRKAMVALRLEGLDLALVRQNDAWQVHGLRLGAGDGGFSMGALGALEVRHATLSVEDVERHLALRLRVPALQLVNHGDSVHARVRVQTGASDANVIDAVAEVDPERQSGSIYAVGRKLDLAAWSNEALPFEIGVVPVAGTGDAELWMRLDGGRIGDARARVDFSEVVLGTTSAVALEERLDVLPRVRVGEVAAAVRWQRSERDWTLDVAGLRLGAAAEQAAGARAALPPTAEIALAGAIGEAPTLRVGMRGLELQPLADLAMLSHLTPAGWRRWLYLARPAGRIERAALTRGEDGRLEVIDAAVRAVQLAPTPASPGIERIDLDVYGDADALRVTLPQQAVRIAFPRSFRWPFALSEFSGDVVAWPSDDGWRIETDRLTFEAADGGFGGEARGGVDLYADERRPSLDLAAHIAHAEVTAAKRFWTVDSMPAQSVEWLDRALVSGKVVGGRGVFRGNLADWPFHNHAGRLSAVAEVEDGVLDFNRQWPRAEKLRAEVRFIDTRLEAEADTGETLGTRIANAKATIPDLGHTELDLDIRGEGPAAPLLAYFRAIPPGKERESEVRDLTLDGRAGYAVKVHLPVRDLAATMVDGRVTFAGARIRHARYGLEFTDAKGELRFDQKSVRAEAIDAEFRGGRAKLGLAIAGAVADPANALEGRLVGTYPPATVFADMPQLASLWSRTSGESSWSVEVAVPRERTAAARLTLASDLAGTALDLPAPLGKPAAKPLPVRIGVELPYAGKPLSVSLGDVATLAGRLPESGNALAAHIRFGGQAEAPPVQGIRIDGRVATLDAVAWMRFLAAVGSGESAGLVSGVELDAEAFVVSDQRFRGLRLRYETVPQRRVIFDSDTLAGTIGWPGGASAIEARFARIHWPESSDSTAPPSTVDVAPASVPPLSIRIDDFRLGKASFGSAVFESRPTASGMSIERLESRSPDLSMKATGDWTGAPASSRSRLLIDLQSPNLGRMMAALGFSGLIEGGRARARIDASFPGPPSSFALAALDGNLSLDVAEGRILDVEPGAGRLFGLLSLTELPRRLILDFSDFFQSGLTFRSIQGQFTLKDGNAWTDDLAIKSSVADILISGRTGLRAKDYDQRIRVLPRASATLPVVGALAAGPVGAAAGLVMQGILSKPLGQAMARTYKVTGPWAKPVIVTLAKQRVGVAAADAAAPRPPDASDPVPDLATDDAVNVPWGGEWQADPRRGMQPAPLPAPTGAPNSSARSSSATRRPFPAKKESR